MEQAITEAERFIGSTAPNPPVGAAGLDARGQILCIGAHERAGSAHAEARIIRECTEKGLLEKLHTVVVTLEPCNHHGRTPPCTEALLKAPSLKRVVIGALDPNLQVKGGGMERLRQAGIEAEVLSDPTLSSRCEELIRPFRHWVMSHRPWVVVKTAINRGGTMIPPAGQKTFTTPESLRFAHELRKRADAIVTGSGTVLSDEPLFTIRHIPDHPGKTRWLVVLDRRRRVPAEWIRRAEDNGFHVVLDQSLDTVWDFLGKMGVLEALVEAGPTLTQAVLSSGIWERHVVMTQRQELHQPDEIKTRLKGHEFTDVYRNC